ncbi:selenide, water dikinase SelD [Yoonia sp. 2307UL14-13]|uniref:selenide, water dikinase SelD n=1 Tax=Yoonia sp. 2307UL14-13 TaxID=3126506 RepID=UPI00309F276A
MNSFPLTRDLVLIGGGHTHALVLRSWGMNPLPGARLTVINPGPTAPYSGMLPGFVAGHYTRDELDIDLIKLARFAGARLINGAADGIDREAQTVHVPGHPPIAYDTLAVDVGITSAMPALPGFAQHGIPAKPLGTFASRWDAFRNTTQEPQIAIIGGGVAGAELAMAMAYALRDKAPKVRLIEQAKVLTALGYKARQLMLAALRAAEIDIIEDAQVTEIFAEGIILHDGRTIRSDFTTGAAGAKPHDWIAGTGLDLHEGFVTVDRNLQSSDPNIFAVGDCAHLRDNPRSKAGVYAVREAPVLYDNLRAALSGGSLRPYKPQNDYLKLISLGEKSALAEKFGTARQGPWLWKLKDYIDRKFMDQFDELPVMRVPKPPRTAALGMKEALGDKPICGGCGAKVGRGALQTLTTFGDDAAEVQRGQFITTDHLRTMVYDPVMMTRVAAIHALGDIWAMGAQPQAATAQIILPRMSAELQARTLSEITEAATKAMEEAGAKIVGGHTSVGEELTIGFTITGLTDQPITLTGARPGDALILTKPIGSGTIMAAEMAGQAKGSDVIACLDLMTQSQAQAAAILRTAHAMTDVTGFGLAGHLRNMCEASAVGASLNADAIPTMQGAEGLSEQGIRSSLFADNKTGAGQIMGSPHVLLFDPQTAGGLLAAVDADTASGILNQLQDAGYKAAIIGTITEDQILHVS